jgi:aerobic carbon-monoxide dehydrogenase medium subunit
MYPRPFEYRRPETLSEATAALAEAAGEARVIAGGQSLVPMMSLGLVQPDLLVDIGRLPLAGAEGRNGVLSIGALTRHRELERSAEFAERLPLAAEAAHYIGNPRVRNRGTFGGSLAHADPASELGAVALTYGGRAVIAGPEGERSIPISEFFEGFFVTAVRPGELLVRVDLELPPPGTGHGFHEIAGRADDFATAAATALVTVDDRGACAEARLALAGVSDRPIRFAAAEELCRGQALTGDCLDRVAAATRDGISPEDDAFISGAYRTRAAATCARRALEAAWRRARGEAA